MAGSAGGSSLPPPPGGLSGLPALTIVMAALNSKHTTNTQSIVFHDFIPISPFFL
jgi:hypothetical protein